MLPDRSEGSSGEALAVGLILETLNKEGIAYRIIPFDDLETASSRSLIIEAEIGGQTSGEMVLVVPINNPEEDPSGGNFNIPLALETLRMYRIQPRRLGLRVIFLGCEKRNESKVSPLGSSHYVEEYREDRPGMVYYLDFNTLTDTVTLDTGTTVPVSPLWLVRDTLGSLKRVGLPSVIKPSRLPLARIGLSDSVSPLTPWLADEIPSLRLADSDICPCPEWKQRITVSRLGRFFYEMGDRYAEGFPESGDVNYILFILPGDYPILIREGNQVLTYFILLAFLILLSLVNYRKLKFNIRRDVVYLWSGPVFLFLSFLFLFLSTLILELVCTVRDFPLLWSLSPRIFFVFKITLTYLLTLAFLHLIGGLPVSRSPHFYSYSAIAAALFNILILSLIHISLSLFYLWPLFLLILFQLSRRVLLKTILAILMPLLILPALYLALSPENTEFSRLLIMSRKGGNLFIAFGILPFLFAVSSLNNHTFYYTGSRRKAGVFLSTLASGMTAAGLLVYIFLFLDPWSNRPIPVAMDRHIDMTDSTQVIQIVSPSPPPPLTLTFPDGTVRTLIRPTRIEKLAYPYSGPQLNLEKEKRRFLGREKYVVRITAPGKIRRVRLEVKSQDILEIYNCNYPYEMSPGGLSAQIYPALNPADPFVLELTIKAGTQGEVDMNLTVSDFEDSVGLTGRNIAIHETITLYQSVPIGYELPSP